MHIVTAMYMSVLSIQRHQNARLGPWLWLDQAWAFNRYHWLFHGLVGFIFLILEVNVKNLPAIICNTN